VNNKNLTIWSVYSGIVAFCELGKHQIQKSSNWRFYQALFEHLKIKNCRRVGWVKKTWLCGKRNCGKRGTPVYVLVAVFYFTKQPFGVTNKTRLES